MIPVSAPLLGEQEMSRVHECLSSGWISSAGQFIPEFESRWAAYCGRRHGIAVCNGTAALQLAVAALGIGAGDEVILPTFTIISCVLAVLYSGAKPVLVDADPETWCMNVEQLGERITARTRAIMPVHIYGHPVNMDRALDVARERGLYVIEDAAEAHGAEYRSPAGHDGDVWRRCGSFGDVSIFSFYANKPVTTGEGGMLVTDDDRLAAKLRSLRNLAFDPGPRFVHSHLGFNFRLTNVQAAIGLGQLERLDVTLARKREIASAYRQRLAGVAGVALQVERPWARSIYWMFGIVAEHQTADAAALAESLRERGVETRPFFLGMHAQPVLRERGLFAGESYPVADHLRRRGLHLPSGVALEPSEIAQVTDAIRELLA